MPDKTSCCPLAWMTSSSLRICAPPTRTSRPACAPPLCEGVGLWEQVVDGWITQCLQSLSCSWCQRSTFPVLDVLTRTHPFAQVTKPWQPCEPLLNNAVSSLSALCFRRSRGATQTISLQKNLGNAGPTCLCGCCHHVRV